MDVLEAVEDGTLESHHGDIGHNRHSTLARSLNREHFGLHGIQERARAMGGEGEVLSQNEAGTRIMINLPINGRANRA